MAVNDYHFATHWRIEGTVEEVYDILGDAPALSRWWPDVYLEVRQTEPGDTRGVGKVVELLTKGKLPYRLRWKFRVTQAERPYGFTIEAWGDFVGSGIWTFEQNGVFVQIVYDWRIRADKPLLQYLSFLMKPLFAANHRWAMNRGEESLRRELLRYRRSKEDQ